MGVQELEHRSYTCGYRSWSIDSTYMLGYRSIDIIRGGTGAQILYVGIQEHISYTWGYGSPLGVQELKHRSYTLTYSNTDPIRGSTGRQILYVGV